jgi:hypothetical protein
MSDVNKIKINTLKSTVLVPIEISASFYKDCQSCSLALLESFPDPKQVLIDLENKRNLPEVKLTPEEYSLLIIMSIIKEVETVAFSNKNLYVEEVLVNTESEN